MNRRNFLKTTALGALGLTLPFASCSKKINSDAPVIVIGGGISGLGAASALKRAGFSNITVLEGRDRLGGRIWTDRSLGFPLDLGAAWVHGSKGGNPIMALVSQSGAETFYADEDSRVIYDTNGSRIDDGRADSYEKNFKTMLSDIGKSAQTGQSLKSAIQQYNGGYLSDNLMKFFISSDTEFDVGASIDEIDAKLWETDDLFSGKDVLFPNGYDAVVNLLAEDLTIRRNATVSRIEMTASGARVTVNTGEQFNAKYVICTLPLGVLKSGVVQFSPALPTDKQDAVSHMKMGYLNKVAMLFPSAFWETDKQTIGYCSEIMGQYPYFFNGKKFTNANLLVGFGFGNYALTMEGQSVNQIGFDVMVNLRKIYGNSIPNYTQIAVTKWKSDPFAVGAYSFMNVGASEADYNAFETPIENKIFFAGEHTISQYRGTVHGAYISGVREAEKIMNLEG